MNRMLQAGAFALAALLASLASQPLTSSADTMMKAGATSMNCKNADAMMMKMAHSDDAMMPAKTSGNADQDFAKMMMVHHADMVAMAKVEAKCGKNAQVRANAQKMLDRLTQMKADLELILHTP